MNTSDVPGSLLRRFCHYILVLTLILLVTPSTLVVIASAQAQAEAIATNLISCWTLDESSGVRTDSYGVYDLTDNNTVGQATAKLGGGAGQFVAANTEYLSHADVADLRAPGSFTVLAWIYADSIPSSNARIVSKRAGLNDMDYDVVFTNGRKARLIITDGTATYKKTNNSVIMSIATWYMVVAWYERGTGELGVQVNDIKSTGAATLTKATSTAAFEIGNRAQDQNRPFDGRTDEVVYWQRSLTGDEIAWLYNGGNGRTCIDITGQSPTSSNYSTQQITLPSGAQGLLEMRASIGEVLVAAGLVLVITLMLFYLIRNSVLQTRAVNE